MLDFATRVSAGETLAELISDLHYGVMAELEECLRIILSQIQSRIEENVNNPIGNNNSSEPTKIQLLHDREGAFFLQSNKSIMLKNLF
jgi:hypothetical protein